MIRERKIVAGGEDVMFDPKTVELGTEQIGIGATSRVFKGRFSDSAGVVTNVACKEHMVTITAKHRRLNVYRNFAIRTYFIILGPIYLGHC